MTKKIQLLLSIFALLNFGFAQESKLIKGKITVIDGNPKGILILNLNSEKETKSDFDGNFNIEAKIDDLIVFQSENLEYLRKTIDEKDFLTKEIAVKMSAKINQLDEVKIFNYPKINALSLGILSKPAKQYTLAERRLYAATSGGGLMVLMNALNGQTKMLKRYVAFEKIEARTIKLTDMFEPDFYTKTLTIPEAVVNRFIIYASEEESVMKAMTTKNKFLVSFELVKVAENFKKLQHEK